jgi:3-methyl-2-oxobutanoate hydroxymethyltransferase
MGRKDNAMSDNENLKVTIPSLQAKKAAGERIVALTAYDFPQAGLVEAAGVDLILVGDSLGMVVLGYPNTVPVTMEEMIHHTKAVTRACRRALVIGDMPYFSFHLSAPETIRNASRFLKEAGAAGVKIEGASPARLRLVRALVEAEIPVMGHVGLTPQSIHRFGRYAVRGKEAAEAERILEGARALEAAGAFAVVLECVPAELSRLVTRSLAIPTIGIGAGPDCDGQVLVLHDLLGYTAGPLPKFVRPYADLRQVIGDAVRRYAEDVRRGSYPDDAHAYHMPPFALRALSPKGRREKGT